MDCADELFKIVKFLCLKRKTTQNSFAVSLIEPLVMELPALEILVFRPICRKTPTSKKSAEYRQVVIKNKFLEHDTSRR